MDQVSKKGPGSGSGPPLGKEKQPGKGTNCKANNHYRLFPCEQTHIEGETHCKSLSIKFLNDHNHAISSTESWNFLGVTKETREKYLKLFEEGYTPSTARKEYIAYLKEKLGEAEYFEISSKSSVNPKDGFIFNQYTKYLKRFGTINGPDTYFKSVELIEKINERAQEKIASIRQLDCGTVEVAVCDQLMKRVHTLVPQSGDVMFVDATGSLDCCCHQIDD